MRVAKTGQILEGQYGDWMRANQQRLGSRKKFYGGPNRAPQEGTEQYLSGRAIPVEGKDTDQPIQALSTQLDQTVDDSTVGTNAISNNTRPESPKLDLDKVRTDMEKQKANLDQLLEAFEEPAIVETSKRGSAQESRLMLVDESVQWPQMQGIENLGNIPVDFSELRGALVEIPTHELRTKAGLLP